MLFNIMFGNHIENMWFRSYRKCVATIRKICDLDGVANIWKISGKYIETIWKMNVLI